MRKPLRLYSRIAIAYVATNLDIVVYMPEALTQSTDIIKS